MSNKVYYILDGSICKTNCPFIFLTKVYSNYCTNCKSFVSVNEIEGYVKCNEMKDLMK